MKLFSLRLTTLKSKLYAIVFASFVVRVVAFFQLPETVSYLGPDEGNYGELTKWIAKGEPANEYPYATLYISSRALIFPATLLNRLGIGGLDSVRIIASIYGLFTAILVTCFFLKLQKARTEVSSFIAHNQNKSLILMAIFIFLPSNLIWSILGLRESTLMFWVLVVFILIYHVITGEKNPSKLALGGILIAIPLVFSSRPQVGLVLGVTLLVYLFFRLKIKAAQILFPLVLVASFLGFAITTATSTQTEQTDKTFVESGIRLGNPGSVILNQVDRLSFQYEVNKVDAESAIETQACPNAGTSRFDNYFCTAYRAPFTTYTFLIRPMLGTDVTSSSSLFAAIENTFWLGAFLFVVFMLIRNRRLAFFEPLLPSLLFFSIYSVAAGAYEGNMGTAFRHKSLILWVVLLLLASTVVATQQRKAEREGISGSSQE
jgi:hypothetical protein